MIHPGKGMMKNKKVLLVASHGGHWVQMRKMAPAFDGMDIHYVSTTQCIDVEVSPAPVTVVKDANLTDKLGLLLMAFQVFWVVLRFRPNVVLSTGAAPGFFALFFGKMLGAKTIWVDSIANAEKLSVSGEKVGRYADLWLTQWPHLEKPQGPFFKGSVL